MGRQSGVAVRIRVIDEISARLDVINRQIDKFTARPRAVANAMANLSQKSGITALGGALQNAAEKTSVLGQRVGHLVGPLAMIGQAATLAGVVAIAKHFGDAATAISRASAETGVASDRLQALQYAAKTSGSSAESMTAGLTGLSQVLRDASLGQNSEAVMGLNALGISLRDTQGHVRSAADVLPDLADRLKNIHDPAQAAFVATTFFGGAGRDLLPTLQQGSVGIKNLTDEAQRYGVVIGGDGLKAGRDFALSTSKLTAVLTGLGNSIGAKIVPVLTPLIDKITAWVAANRELISTRVEEIISKISSALQRVDFDKVLAGLTSFVQGVGSVIDFLGGFQNAGIAALVFLNGPLILSAISAAKAFVGVGVAVGGVAIRLGALAIGGVVQGFNALSIATKACAAVQWILNAAMAANPIGLVVVGVAALAAGAYAVYSNWSSITEWFGRQMAAIGNFVSDTFGGIGDFIQGKISNVLGAFQDGFLPGLMAVFREFNPISLMADSMNGLVKWLTGFDLADAGSKIIGSLVDGLKSMFPDLAGIADKISGFFSAILPGEGSGGEKNRASGPMPDLAGRSPLDQLASPPALTRDPPPAGTSAANSANSVPSVVAGTDRRSGEGARSSAIVEVLITARDMPRGTTVSAVTSGPVSASVNVGYSGVGGNF